MGTSAFIKQVAREPKQTEGKTFGRWIVSEINDQTTDDQIVKVNQTHGGNIVRAAHITSETEADGIYLSIDDDRVIGIDTADCAPVIIMTEEKVLALHVSRKTIVNGLLDNALNYLEPKEIDNIYVGPHICEFHNTYSHESLMLRRFRLRFGRATHWHHGSIYLSLKTALQYFFDEWEIHPNKINYDGRCTYEMLALPSYRREIDAGRSGAIGRLVTTVRHRILA